MMNFKLKSQGQSLTENTYFDERSQSRNNCPHYTHLSPHELNEMSTPKLR